MGLRSWRNFVDTVDSRLGVYAFPKLDTLVIVQYCSSAASINPIFFEVFLRYLILPSLNPKLCL